MAVNLRSKVTDERGFTLIEMLLVLLIVGVLTTAVLHFSLEQIQRHTYRKAIAQVELIVRSAQALAMEEERAVYCEVLGGTRFIVKTMLHEPTVYTYDLPEGMQMSIATTGLRRIQFHPSGKITNAGSVHFYFDNHHVYYSINIGKGRFLLHE